MVEAATVRAANNRDLAAITRLFLHQRRQLPFAPAAAPSLNGPLDAMAMAIEAIAATRALIERWSGGLFVAEKLDAGLLGMATLVFGEHIEAHGFANVRAGAWRRIGERGVEPGTARVATLLSLWVEPSDRRSGVGSALVCHAIRCAAERGCQLLRVDFDGDDPALVAFYAGLGFEIIGPENFPELRAGQGRPMS
jgi:GNAT superfamily N-acetyltransferase